jgi:putative endonuclease
MGNPRGKEGEETAVKILQEKGFSILERNYHFGKGEIDIIAEDTDGDLVFIEVKYRGTNNYGEPEYAITESKKKQIKKIASAYLYEKDISDKTCRFDVFCILEIPGEEPEINHYIDAFR